MMEIDGKNELKIFKLKVRYLLGTIASIVIVILISGYIATLFRVNLDSSDDSVNGLRSGLKTHVDHQTGCQYLSAAFGGITPRISRGKHMGCTTTK